MADVFKACFSDFKLIKGRKVAQLVLEVPIEQADAALATLGGVPRPDVEQWVGVAPLKPEAAEKPKGGKLAQRAGILCGEMPFWRYLYEEWGADVCDVESASEWIRIACLVESRADLDHDPKAAAVFSDIETAYRNWMRS